MEIMFLIAIILGLGGSLFGLIESKKIHAKGYSIVFSLFFGFYVAIVTFCVLALLI